MMRIYKFLAQFSQHLRRVVFGLDLLEGLYDDAVLVDEVRGAHDAKGLLAVHVLFVPDVICFDGFELRVRKKCEGKLVLLFELLVGRNGVLADTDDDGTFFPEGGHQIAKGTGLGRAARRVVSRVEVQDDLLAFILLKGVDCPIFIRQFECRRFRSNF